MGEMFDAPGPPESQPEEKRTDQEIADGYPTDVEGVVAHDVIKQGHNEFPVFDCTENEFYQNMQHGRKRLRFSKDSAASKYMAGTRYQRAFYIRTTDSSGKTYTRKIK